MDWEEAFGHGIVLLETFVDATRFSGTVYKAANWTYVGDTKGYRRIRHGYSATTQTPKKVFLMPLRPDAQAVLCRPELPTIYQTGGSKMIRDIIIRVNPVELDRALQCWNVRYDKQDRSLAIDGKVMRNALGDQGHQTYIVSVVGYQTQYGYAQKKSEPCLPTMMKPSNEPMRSI
ncbi:MAG: DUF4338 domain-containing protein [Syntrophaceae bacterium]|nr:DUF4338 domain-containing protein [Syntrophaceae bacterium]